MISKALRILRTLDESKAKDFAQKLGISTSYLSEIENGKKKPTYELLEKYSEVLGIKMSALLFFSEELDTTKLTNNLRLKSINSMLKILGFVTSADEEDLMTSVEKS